MMANPYMKNKVIYYCIINENKENITAFIRKRT